MFDEKCRTMEDVYGDVIEVKHYGEGATFLSVTERGNDCQAALDPDGVRRLIKLLKKALKEVEQ